MQAGKADVGAALLNRGAPARMQPENVRLEKKAANAAPRTLLLSVRDSVVGSSAGMDSEKAAA